MNQQNTVYVGPNDGQFPLTRAKDAATAGTTIVVLPGTYDENNLLKDGVNWHFMNGAVVSRNLGRSDIKNSSSTVKAVFDDNSSAVTCKITGEGSFHFNYGVPDWVEDEGLPFTVTPNSNRFGLLQTNNAGTNIHLEFLRCTHEGYSNGGIQMVYVRNCERVELVGREMVTINPTTTFDIATEHEFGPITVNDLFGGVWWAKGETYVTIDRIKSGAYAIYPEGTGVTDATNLWVKSALIESVVQTLFYSNGNANANYKVWMEVDELRGTNTDVFHIQSDGKIYVVAKKVGSTAGSIGYAQAQTATGMEFWLTSQKLSTAPVSGASAMAFGSSLNAFPVKSFIQVQHYEDTHSNPSSRLPATTMIENLGAGATTYIQGGVVIAKQNCQGIKHTAGAMVASGVRIECNGSNDVDNKPVVVAAGGLALDGCTLLAPALADSIYAGTAQNVKIYGQTFTNKAKNANVTTQVGTLTVDANVS